MTTDQETSILSNLETALASPPALPKRKSKWVGWVVFAAIVFAAYHYSDVLAYWSGAEQQCLKFAEENEVSPAWQPDPSDKKLFVVRKYISGTNVVVELGQKQAGKKGYQSRLCVLGNSQIMIPGAFEQWQYR